MTDLSRSLVPGADAGRDRRVEKLAEALCDAASRRSAFSLRTWAGATSEPYKDTFRNQARTALRALDADLSEQMDALVDAAAEAVSDDYFTGQNTGVFVRTMGVALSAALDCWRTPRDEDT